MSRQDDYRQTLLSQLQELDARLDQLGKRFEQIGSDARVEARKQLQAFRAQRSEALARLQSWDEVKHGVDRAWYEHAG